MKHARPSAALRFVQPTTSCDILEEIPREHILVYFEVLQDGVYK